MIIAEFTLDHPILRGTLERNPEMDVTWEQSYRTDDDRMQMVFWAKAPEFDRIEAAMDDDPSVGNPTLIADLEGRRLYRVDLTADGRTKSIIPLLVDLGAVQQELTATHEGWRNRVQFPDREAFEEVYQFCRDHDIGFTFNRIYESAERFGESPPKVTDAQHETLLEAVDSGYLDIPRRCSLAELGDRLGVSESAVSERFRRGVRNLVTETLR